MEDGDYPRDRRECWGLGKEWANIRLGIHTPWRPSLCPQSPFENQCASPRVVETFPRNSASCSVKLSDSLRPVGCGPQNISAFSRQQNTGVDVRYSPGDVHFSQDPFSVPCCCRQFFISLEAHVTQDGSHSMGGDPSAQLVLG